jgi:hypothetical protein
MSALTSSTQRTRFHGRDPLLIAHPAKTGVSIFAGALVCREAASNLVIPASDTANLVFIGVATEELVSTANGAYGPPDSNLVRVDHDGIFAFAVGATTPKSGDAAHVLDDNTVGVAADATNDIRVGVFLRPALDGTSAWFVDPTR